MLDSNVILYIIVFLFCMTLTVFLGKLIIPFLKDRAEQPIYEGGPSWHVSKSGTPTMGGLSFVFSVTVTLLLCVLYNLLLIFFCQSINFFLLNINCFC